jgi:hypothetical protein
VKRTALLLFFIGFTSGCDWVARIPWLYKTYEHPTYRFALRVPRSWTIDSGTGLMGAQVVLLASEEDRLFRANLNVVVQPRPAQRTLKQEATVSLQQLRLMMNEYEALSDAAARIDSREAYEIRGRYRATEGYRILRTILTFTDDLEYILTFTCREEREISLQPEVKTILESFHAPASLSARP